MSFLNATLLLALGAAAVPIILHLIAKREPKKVVFPSVRFLTKTFESNRAKLRIRRWWLLALRIAALAVLALALARPVIHQSLSVTWLTIGLLAIVGVILLVLATVAFSRGQSKPFTLGLAAVAALATLTALGWAGYTYASGKRPSVEDDSPAALAVLLDNSLTAGWKTPEEDRLERMKQIARQMIAKLPNTSRIAVIDRSTTPAAFSLDLASALSKVDQIRPLAVAQPIAAKLDAAMRLVRTSDLENRQLLVISDLASHSWDTNSHGKLAALASEEPEVGITVFDLAKFEGMNRSLSSPRVLDLTPPKGVSIPVTMTVGLEKIDDKEDALSVTAELKLYESDPSLPVIRNGEVKRPDLKDVDRKSVQISSGSQAEILLTIPPLETGVHHGVIKLVGDDALSYDDTRYFSLAVLPPSHLLLVNDNADESFVVGTNITTPLELDDPNAEFAVERVTYDDLPAVQIKDFDAAILMDPPPEVLSDEALVDFVQNGGNVFAAIGRSAGTDKLALDHLPVLERPWRSPAPHTYLSPLQAGHPILAPLNDIPGGVPWGDFRIQQYWQVTPRENDQVLMRFAGTKHPALLQCPGNGPQAGSWFLLTTPIPDLADPARSWNDLFGVDAWPTFALILRTAEVISGRGEKDLTLGVGQPKILDIPAGNSENETRRLQLFAPGDTSPVPMNVAADATQVAVSDALQAGTYWLRGTKTQTGFSANASEESTSTDRIPPGELDDWFGPDNYSLVTDETKLKLANSSSESRVSLRSPIMMIALAVFLLELVLSNRFYRSRSSNQRTPAKRALAA